MKKLLALVVVGIGASGAALAQTDWNAPFPPHQVIDNVYYIGTRALASFLVTTPDGHVLINSDFESTVPILQKNVEALGFRFDDIAVIVGSHAHGDHMEGDALDKELTGATVMAMEQDVPGLRAMRPGGKEHPVDRVLTDGERVEIGGEVLTAHRTGGHTEGCTSWGLQVEEDGRTYDVLVVCSFGVNAGYVLVDNPDYPEIADDYRRTFARARELPVDVFLASHGTFYGLEEKHERLQRRAPGDPNPFVDREGYLAHVATQERNFLARLAEQQPPPR
jgi:metallo-beta-lactamase class B